MASSSILIINIVCLFLVVNIILQLFNIFNQSNHGIIGLEFKDYIKANYANEITDIITLKHIHNITANSPGGNSCQSCIVDTPSFLQVPPKGWCITGHDSVVILINSKPDNFKRRVILRHSWIRHLKDAKYKLNISYVFLVGQANQTNINKQLKREVNTFKDILLLDYIDEYNKLSFKTLSGFKLVQDQCRGVEMVFKIDDDVFINPFALQSSLHKYKIPNIIQGNCFGSGYPHRSPTSKWYASYKSYPHKYYPPFCLGAALMMTSQTSAAILEASHKNPIFHIEDVYISGLLAKASGVKTKSVNGFHTHKVSLSKVCPWASEIISVLLKKDEEFYQLNKELMSHICL